jgi:hypothetical protein
LQCYSASNLFVCKLNKAVSVQPISLGPTCIMKPRL